MIPSKFDSPQDQPEEIPDITDIAQIFQKLNNRHPNNFPKPYSEYDAESIFPPPSQISLNNQIESDKSKSNCLVNIWKRSGVSQNKQEKIMGFSLSKPQLGSKKLKTVEVQKLNPNQKLIHKEKLIPQNPALIHSFRQEQVSNKDSLPNNNNNKDLVSLHPPALNFKITDFFKNKKVPLQKNKQKTQKNQNDPIQNDEGFLKIRNQEQKKNQFTYSFTNIEDSKINPIINSLMQKNSKKRKVIEDLKQQLKAYKQRKLLTSIKLLQIKNEEKKKLKQKLLQTNQIKMQYNQFSSQISSVLLENNLQKKIIPSIQQNLKNLQDNKRKGAHKKGNNRKQTHTDQESVGNNQNRQFQNPLQIPQKKHYVNQWIGKLEKLKEKLQTDTKFYKKLSNINQKIQKVSSQIQEKFFQNQVLRDYVLFSMNYLLTQNKTRVNQMSEINAFNLQNLRYQILSVLKLPKFSTQVSKKLICKQLSNLYKLSKKLHNSASCYFLQTTVAQTTKNTEFIVYGREKIDQNQGLLSVLQKFEGFSETMIKYITKVCLIVLEEIKVKVDIPVFLLPLNIYFSPKCDIKFSNVLMNNLFIKEQFKSYLSSNKLYYFLPPEGLSQKEYSNGGIWSLGILLYFIIYEKYPFEYEMDSLFQKETFWIYNQLTFPSKPVVSQKLKDFIISCLMYKEKEPSLLAKHQFLNK